ncbi:MAG: hypothetical protein F6K17_34685 [Okeania sp. SIO3C4]|nr:hypothetical protein [Okeania sp. SIO3B3]NER07350.1 hypothetical protein [Okeania sp. SIO3C4]
MPLIENRNCYNYYYYQNQKEAFIWPDTNKKNMTNTTTIAQTYTQRQVTLEDVVAIA